MAVGEPFDVEVATVEPHLDLAAGEAPAVCGDRRGAGPGAACLGQAGAAFPHAQAQSSVIDDLGDADIGALGKQRVVLELGPQLVEGDCFGIGDEEHGVGIAHIDADGVAQRSPRQRQMVGVAFAGQRDILPAVAGRTHVDGVIVSTAIGWSGRDQSGGGFQHNFGLRAFLEQQAGDAAGGISARRNFTAVGIVDAHKGGGAAIASRFDGNKLVEANTGVAVGERARSRRIHSERLPARVDDNEIVAQSVHLYEIAGRHDRDIGLQGTMRPAKRLVRWLCDNRKLVYLRVSDFTS
jgi:hypothetical protein